MLAHYAAEKTCETWVVIYKYVNTLSRTASQSQENACILLLCRSNTSLCHKLQPTYKPEAWVCLQQNTERRCRVQMDGQYVCCVLYFAQHCTWLIQKALETCKQTLHPTKILIVHASSSLTWTTHKCCFSFVAFKFSADAVETKQLIR